MHHKNFNVIFCSEIGQKHIGADTQKEIIQILKDETPNLIYKYPWTKIYIIHKNEESITVDLYGFVTGKEELKSVINYLKSREFSKLWAEWSW